MIVFHIDYNLVVFGNLFCQNLFRQVVQQIPLDHPFHRPGTELRVIPFLSYPFHSFIGNLDGNTVVSLASGQYPQSRSSVRG